jgi:hypothetical protein
VKNITHVDIHNTFKVCQEHYRLVLQQEPPGHRYLRFAGQHGRRPDGIPAVNYCYTLLPAKTTLRLQLLVDDMSAKTGYTGFNMSYAVHLSGTFSESDVIG